MLEARKIDSKGRVMLGSEYAGAVVLLEQAANGDIIIHPAAVVPLNEAWLHNNPKAAASVARGLKQATEGKFADDPIDVDSEDWLKDE